MRNAPITIADALAHHPAKQETLKAARGRQALSDAGRTVGARGVHRIDLVIR